MSKKYYYYLVFILIPVYIFSGSIIDYIHNRDNIVNTLEMPQKNYDNTISDSQKYELDIDKFCLLYTSPSPRDATLSRMPSSA